jgi:NAD(P)H-flavin reductase/ferredoxin
MAQVAEAIGLYPVRLLPEDRVFLVKPGEDVLTAGLRQGIDLRYGCRHGKCTSCKYLVVEGDVVHRGASPYAFSDRELEEGGVLLCSTFACSPLVITPFDPQPVAEGFALIPPEERIARVVSLVSVSADLVEVRLRPDAPLLYRPGQYVEIEVPGRLERRSYSVANPPAPDGTLWLLVNSRHRRVLEALAAAQAGDGVRVLGPFGRLHLRPSDRPVLMVSAGAGLAPVLAMLREIRARPAAPPGIVLYHGPGPGGLPYPDEFRRLAEEISGFRLVAVEGTGTSPVGRLGTLVRRIGHDVADASGSDAYVAGSPALCDAITALLSAKGLPERRIFAERFYAVSS